MNFNANIQNRLRTFGILVFFSLAIWGVANVVYYQYGRSPHSMKVLVKKQRLFSGSNFGIEVFTYIPGTAAIADNTILETPGAGINVRAVLQSQNKTIVSQADGQTNTDGFCHLDLKIPQKISGDHTLVVSSRENFMYGDSRIEKEMEVAPASKILLSTDKPCYRPGQEIHVRAILLDSFTLEPMANKEVILEIAEIADGENTKLFRKGVSTSEYGIVATSFKLPDEVRRSTCTIVAQEGDNKTKITVGISQCKPPAFKVKLTLDAAYLLARDAVKGTVDAWYSSGKPVADGKLELDFEIVSGLSPETRKLDAVLNSQGSYTFSVEMQPPSLGNNEIATLFVKARVTDADNSTAETGKRLPISMDTLLLDVVPEAGYIVPGVENILYCMIATSNGVPVPEATITVGDTKLTTDRYGIARYRVVPKPKKMLVQATIQSGSKKKECYIRLLPYKKEERFAGLQVFSSKRDNEPYLGIITLDQNSAALFTKITIPEWNLASKTLESIHGFTDPYRKERKSVTLKIEDGFGNMKTLTQSLILPERRVYAIERAYRTARVLENPRYTQDDEDTPVPCPAILLRTNRGVYLENEPIEVEIVSSFLQSDCVLEVCRNERTVEQKVLSFQDGRAACSILPRFTGTLQLLARSRQKEGVFYECGKVVYVASQDELQVKMESDKTVYGPGEKAKFLFQLADEKGMPKPGVIGLTVAEQNALDLEENKEDGKRHFFALDPAIVFENASPEILQEIVFEEAPKILPGTFSLSKAIFRRLSDKDENLDDVTQILLARASASQSLLHVNMTQTTTENGFLQTALPTIARIGNILVPGGIFALFLSVLLALGISMRQNIRLTEARDRDCLEGILAPALSASCVNAAFGLFLVLIMADVPDMSAVLSSILVMSALLFVVGFTLWKLCTVAQARQSHAGCVVRWVYRLCFLHQTIFFFIFVLLPITELSLSEIEICLVVCGLALMPLAFLFLRNEITGDSLFSYDPGQKVVVRCYLAMLTAIYIFFCVGPAGLIVGVFIFVSFYIFGYLGLLAALILGVLFLLYRLGTIMEKWKADWENFPENTVKVMFGIIVAVSGLSFILLMGDSIDKFKRSGYFSRFGQLEVSVVFQLEMGHVHKPGFVHKSDASNLFFGRSPNFCPETLYANPSLVTDDYGRASVELQIGDSITAWQAAVLAHTLSGKIAKSNRKILVFRP